MNTRKCAECGTEFDFDKTGLEGPGNIFVCGTTCAKRSTKSRGNKYVIHDDSGDIVDTDAKPEDGPLTHLY